MQENEDEEESSVEPVEKSFVDNRKSKESTSSTQISPTKRFQKGSTIVPQTKSIDTAEEPWIVATEQGSTEKEHLKNDSDLIQSEIYLKNTKGNVGLLINYQMQLRADGGYPGQEGHGIGGGV